MAVVDFDGRAVRINGKRKLLISGAIHYPRSTPAMWPELFRLSREAGLNTIETYVFWNLHEAVRGEYDFTGRLDLDRFCREAHAAGLYVVLRIGPYICAETNYGGLPSWLRDVPGIQMRTENPPFQKEMARFVTDLCHRLAPLFVPAGGPIILAQVENEYNNIATRYEAAGKRYLAWCVELGRSLNLGIPWIMCHGGAEGAIETINSFYGHEMIAEHFKRNPGQPALWTEAYPGWYDTWGYGAHYRSVEDMAFAAGEFFAAAGSGINYYMWHGGTNFARESMYLQTTAYFPRAPLNEYGQETTMSRHLARLHHLLHQYADVMLAMDVPEMQLLNSACTARSYHQGNQRITFLSNTTQSPAKVSVGGRQLFLSARSVQLLDANDVVLFDSGVISQSDIVSRTVRPESTKLELISQWAEPLPSQRVDTPIVSDTPLEQLSLTADRTDYCWYSTTLPGGAGELLLDGVADFVRIWIDSKPVACSATPLPENRAIASRDGFRQKFNLDLPPGEHQLDILCSSLGLIKGDWMLDANMVEEKKGLFGEVTFRGETVSGWQHRSGLTGMSAVSSLEGTAFQPGWWKFQFERPAGSLPLLLDLGSMEKGLAWLNGQGIGRYWITAPAGKNPISPGAPVEIDLRSAPTQQFYHLPSEWLLDVNELIVFDETGVSAKTISLARVV